MRFGVLTGGGDCPGLNAVIRAIVRQGIKIHGHEIVGFRGGWKGVLERDTMPLELRVVNGDGLLRTGATITLVALRQMYENGAWRHDTTCRR